jgi:hypothetical protein
MPLKKCPKCDNMFDKDTFHLIDMSPITLAGFRRDNGMFHSIMVQHSWCADCYNREMNLRAQPNFHDPNYLVDYMAKFKREEAEERRRTGFYNNPADILANRVLPNANSEFSGKFY